MSGQAVEQGETYEHERHGTVKVNGIWKGVSSVDTARSADTDDTIIVHYSLVETDEHTPIPDFADTLDEFLEAIEIRD